MASRRLFKFIGKSFLLHVIAAAVIAGIWILCTKIPSADATKAVPAPAKQNPPARAAPPAAPAAAKSAEPEKAPAKLPEKPADVDLFEKGK